MNGRARAISQSARERAETVYWAGSRTESPGADSLDAFTNKMAEGQVLLEKFERFGHLLRAADTVLELGGGQCWASCFLKREFRTPFVVGSDIAPDAVASLPEWERIFRVDLEGAVACRSYAIPVRDASIDLVVVFASAHHFGAHRRTAVEIARVLRRGGHALYLHEPACRRYLHGPARRRVNRKRPVVPEDVLVYDQIVALAERAGMSAEVIPAPTTTYRGAVETLYYYVLQKISLLQRALPCTVDVVITKR